MLRKGSVVTKEGFLNHLYGGMDEPELKIIDVFICKLRKKLALAGAEDVIGTMWGRGYIVREPAVADQQPAASRMGISPACRSIAAAAGLAWRPLFLSWCGPNSLSKVEVTRSAEDNRSRPRDLASGQRGPRRGLPVFARSQIAGRRSDASARQARIADEADVEPGPRRCGRLDQGQGGPGGGPAHPGCVFRPIVNTRSARS